VLLPLLKLGAKLHALLCRLCALLLRRKPPPHTAPSDAKLLLLLRLPLLLGRLESPEGL
jgi:hypothetical protein